MVGETTITRSEFEAALAAAARFRHFHRRPSETELAELRAEVGEVLINRSLLLAEAARRGLTPDPKSVDAEIRRREGRMAQSPAAEPALRTRIEQDAILSQLEAEVRRSVATAGEDEVRAYYVANPEKFTTPAQRRVAVILLKVDPASPPQRWQAAYARAQDLAAQVRGGRAFSELAREHSGDSSAAQGGDLGFVHAGRFAPEVERVLDTLEPGQVSEPVRLLQGVAIFTVKDTLAARLNSFEEVKERARELLLRERGDAAWQALIETLRRTTPIVIHEPPDNGPAREPQ